MWNYLVMGVCVYVCIYNLIYTSTVHAVYSILVLVVEHLKLLKLA